ncbi:MAG: GGDEF domain-containing protein, partial [Candidatus Omnitrophica bacterium]|nr:GGDEF domain-containing protein [Candidatus Omnitrophota bacterium]
MVKRILFWGIMLAVVFGAASFLAVRFQALQEFLTLFLAMNPVLPTWLSFEQFLVVVSLAGVLIAVVAVAVSAGGWLWMRSGLTLAQYRESAQARAIHKAMEHLRSGVQQEYDKLIRLGETLTQRLEKRALLQHLVQAASQITSLPNADSAVALWAMDLETDQMRFELGLRCDESCFTRQQFALDEPPFPKLFSSQQVMRFPTWEEGFPFVKPEKLSGLGQAKALLLVPLVIEKTVLGCLVVFCHPDILAGYQQREGFFRAAWGQCALALAIAIQGDLAIRDRLTGLVNQTYFLKRLEQEIDRSNRYRVPLGLLMLDIDNFKAVNDTLGHQQGDVVLKMISKLIQKSVRMMDLVGRYGGEEFIVMLPVTGVAEESGGAQGAAELGERIRSAVEQEFHAMQKPLKLTVSVGVVVRRYPDDRQMDAKTMVRLADEQLYKAKTTGKNKCCVYVP